jgi:hypothetical protein
MMTLQLYAPNLSIVLPQCTPYTEYVGAHMGFRAQLTQYVAGPPETLQCLSIAELKAVQKTFPGIVHRNTVLVMAAWFSTLCVIDDMVEAMEVGSAAIALDKCDDMLAGRWTGSMQHKGTNVSILIT